MSNSPYTTFRNTLIDLQNCYDAMEDSDLSPEESKARTRLIELCVQIADEFSDDTAVEDDAPELNTPQGGIVSKLTAFRVGTEICMGEYAGGDVIARLPIGAIPYEKQHQQARLFINAQPMLDALKLIIEQPDIKKAERIAKSAIAWTNK